MFDHDWTAEKVRPIVDTVMAQFGANRVMWGSNFPVCSLSANYQETHNRVADLTKMDPSVFGATARKFYRLQPFCLSLDFALV